MASAILRNRHAASIDASQQSPDSDNSNPLPDAVEIRGHRFTVRVDAFPRRLGRVLWSTGSKQIVLHPGVPVGLRRRTLNAVTFCIAEVISPADNGQKAVAK